MFPVYKILYLLQRHLVRSVYQCLQVCWGLWAEQWIWSWLILAAAETLKKRYTLAHPSTRNDVCPVEKCHTDITHLLGTRLKYLCHQENVLCNAAFLLAQMRLGNSSYSPTIAGLVLEHLCPTIQNILEDGLRDHNLDFIIGQRRNHSWSVVEISTKIGMQNNHLLMKCKGIVWC